MPVKQRFDDIDEHAAQMSGFDQRYVQLSPGPFQGLFSSVELPRGIGFDVEWVAQSVHQQACVPSSTVSLVTFLDLTGRAIFNGHRVNPRDTFVMAPGSELNVRTPPGATIAVITLPQKLLADAVPAIDIAARPHGPAHAIRPLRATALASVFWPVLHALLQALDAEPNVLSHPNIRQSMADGVLDSALALLCRGDGPAEALQPCSARGRREVFLSVLGAIDRLDTENLAVWQLCRMTGVSRRTLEYCFDEALAMSPLQYLKIKRLNAVRRELCAAESAEVTIGDVAARHGIWHLGRLSKEYARLFGELPSATLRRSRSSPKSLRRHPAPRRESQPDGGRTAFSPAPPPHPPAS